MVGCLTELAEIIARFCCNCFASFKYYDMLSLSIKTFLSLSGLTLEQNLSMGPIGPQSPLDMKPDASTLGQFSPQGPNSPNSYTLGQVGLLSPSPGGGGGQKSGQGSPYPPNHPLSGSKHLCSICGDRASGKHYGVYRWVKSIYRLQNRTPRTPLMQHRRVHKAMVTFNEFI